MRALLFIPALLLPSLLMGENVMPIPTSEGTSRTVIDLSKPEAAQQAVPSHAEVSAKAVENGIEVSVQPGPANYPGISIAPKEEAFDLAGTGFVEVNVTNTSTVIINVTLRVDSGTNNATGSAYLKPGETGKARAFFDSPGKGSNPLDAAKVSKILLFIGKNEKVERSFRINTLAAGGKPGEKAPANLDIVRVKPKDGQIFSAALPFDAAKQVVARNGAKAAVTAEKAVGVTFSGKEGENVLIRPIRGYWDLSDQLQVTVRLKNTGAQPAGVKAQLTSQAGTSDFAPEQVIPVGETVDITIPFIPNTPFKIVSDPAQNLLEGKKGWGVEPTPGSRYFSHQTNGLLLSAADTTAASSFEIVDIKAGMPEGDPRPEWLGQRPPVEGEWVKTFEDNFDGDTLDETKWNVYSENYWDKRVGFSKKNVIIGDGLARLRIEKREGFHNDDPKNRATEYATGWLDSYGKWKQAYGYYEIRVKLPTAPSMFPAFWLMPERGPEQWPKYRRTDTKDDGMEFDVFEGQSMWGPYRTTFGAHWDAYMKYHKTAGTTAHYNRPDKDGYLTIGFLWLPGHISVYSQGRMQGSWDSPRIASATSYLIFDLLPGGFEYDPLDPAKLPADLEIDYIRVWQRKDLAENGEKK